MTKPLSKKALRTEVLAGMTTFFTMAYIVIVNPSILSTPGTGMSFSGVLTATVLLCFSMTLLMGLYAKLPFAVAPGMGLNAFFTFSLVLSQKVAWPVALGAVFWSGVCFLVVSLTPLRAAIANSIPPSLRVGAACGIGIFLTFIGLKNAGLVVADPVTFVKMGAFDLKTLLAILGLVLSVVLLKKKNPFAFLASIAFVTLAALALGLIQKPESWITPPDFTSVFLKVEPLSALKLSLLPAIFSLLFTDLFDSISTFVGVSQSAGLTEKNGQPRRLREGLIVDAWATFCASLLGTSPGTAYIESSAGIEVGGRTGLTSVVTALCFLPCLFLAPLAGMVPAYGTAPVLISVGALMFRSIGDLKTKDLEELLPAFLTLVLIPLTFSITQGILWGLVTHVLLFALSGRRKEISSSLWAIGLFSLGLLILEHRV